MDPMDPMIRPPPDPRTDLKMGHLYRGLEGEDREVRDSDRDLRSIFKSPPCIPQGINSSNPMVGAYMGVSLNGGFSPQIIHFNGVFHHKPSILGYHYFWKHPYTYPFYKDSPLKGGMIIPNTKTLDPCRQMNWRNCKLCQESLSLIMG